MLEMSTWPLSVRKKTPVNADQRLLLFFREVWVKPDRLLDPADAIDDVVKETGSGVEGLGRDLKGGGDALEHLGRRLEHAALDLTQVRVGDARHVSQPAQGEI